MFKEHYSKMIEQLKQQKKELQAEIDTMPDGLRKSHKEMKLKQIKVEIYNYICAVDA